MNFCNFIQQQLWADDFQIPPHRQAVSVVGNAMKHPKNYIAPIFLLFFNMSVHGQTKDDRFNVNYGVSITKIDSSLKSEIQFLQFDSSIGVVFPAKYTEIALSQNNDWKNKQAFTPDTSLIRIVENEIARQYCQANKTFEDSTWRYEKASYFRIREHKEFKQAKNRYHKSLNFIDKFCPKWKHDLIYFDKQFMGYISATGERIILIQLCDFRQDPYLLKSRFNESWIDGWHGWFETNRRLLHFNVDKNLLTINEDY
jgi:hypothetical protein